MKKTFIAGGIITALVAGVLAIGLASAQTATPEPTVADTPERLGDGFKEELAKQLGISVDDLNTALNNTQNTLIDQAVADGKLTQSEADKLKERVEDGHNLFPFAGARPFARHQVKVELVQATADVLAVDVATVQDGLQNGDTLAEIANAHGKSTDDFKTELLANVKSTLDSKVSSGDITQDQADHLYDRLSNNIDDIVNRTPGEPPHGFPRFDRGGPRFFDGPDANGGDDSSSGESPTIF